MSINIHNNSIAADVWRCGCNTLHHVSEKRCNACGQENNLNNKITIRQASQRNEHLLLTEDAFFNTYNPLLDEYNTAILTFDSKPEALDIHYLWTMHDCDGCIVYEPGISHVNAFAYFVTTSPWGYKNITVKMDGCSNE